MKTQGCRGMCRRASVLAGVLLLAMGGCAAPTSPKPVLDPASKPTSNRATLPRSGDVIAAYNRRVADITRMRSPVSAVIDVPIVDANGALTGQRQKDQLDGNLQLIQPDRVSLRMDKVQQTVFTLGSGGGMYWFITMGDEPTAYTGAVSKATLAKARSLGLPIHPLDLLELMAVTPMPATAKLSWWDKYIRIVAPARWGTREVLVDAKTYEPVAVWLRDTRGKIAVWAETTGMKTVDVEGKATIAARVPGRIRAVVPGATSEGDTFVELFLSRPENAGSRIREKQFDMRAVLESVGVKQIVDVDAGATR